MVVSPASHTSDLYGIAALVTAISTLGLGLLAYVRQRAKDRQKASESAVSGYVELVRDLRVQVTSLEAEQKECRKRIANLERANAKLRQELREWTGQHED